MPSSRPRTSRSPGTCRRRAGGRCSRRTSGSSSTFPNSSGRCSSSGGAGRRAASTSWRRKGPKLVRHPIRNFRMMPVVLDYSLSIVWSFLYWVSMTLFVLTQLYFAATQNWERFWHNWYMVGIFVAIQMVVGLVQLTAASYYNDGGRTLKYIVFAPWYMLVYWMVNTWTVVVEFIPTLAQGLVASRRRHVEVPGALRQPAGHPRGSRQGAVMTPSPPTSSTRRGEGRHRRLVLRLRTTPARRSRSWSCCWSAGSSSSSRW